MTQPVDVDLNLGGDYVQGVQQATQVTEGLSAAMNTLQAPSRSVQAALTAATPTKAHIAAWGGFVAAAAYWQQQTSGIRATASAAGQSIKVLNGDVQSLARSFPIGTAGAVQLVQAVQGLGAQQRQVLPLAQNFERLAKATTSFGPDMATGFGQLNREMASLNPDRIQAFGDVLTTVSAKSGASAMGMVSFSRSIAPVAQQAGLGESAVLGISSAFVKLGDDGGAAATAVNKILSDLNRSVREGSNDMAAYAQITGMTVDKFRQLYQASPAQALSRVTTAIGRAGPRGQMELENLGLDGVRTQRALLQLSQSGGLGGAINQAVGAYNNGSTQKAAAAAMGGLNDSLTELRSTAGQTADTIGGPFLHALTRVTDIAKTLLAPVNAVLGSGPGQRAIGGLGALALTGMAMRRVVSPLSTAALGQMALTSGPIRGMAGGYALGRTDNDMMAAERMRLGRFGSAAAEAYTQGQPYGRGYMQPLNRGFAHAGYVMGQFRSDLEGGPLTPGTPAPGGGLLRRGLRLGGMASTMAYEGWARTFADPLHQAVTPAGNRTSLLQARPGELFSQAAMVRQQAGLRAAFGFLEKNGSSAAAGLERVGVATVRATDALVTFAGRTVTAGASAGASVVGGVAKSALGLVGGGAGLALAAGFIGYQQYQGSQNYAKGIQESTASQDIYGAIDGYRDAIGKAGEASITLADQMQTAANTINGSISNFRQGRTVTSRDVQAAQSWKQQRQYVGTNTEIASQIQSLDLNGLQPSDLQAAKLDLIKKGLPSDRIEQILALVQPKGSGGTLNASVTQGLVSSVATSARYQGSGGLLNTVKRSIGGAHHGGLWETLGTRGAGTPQVGDQGEAIIAEITGAIGQQFNNQLQKGGVKYAASKELQSASTAVDAALKTHDADTAVATFQRVSAMLTPGNKPITGVSAAALESAGGLIPMLQQRNVQLHGYDVSDLLGPVKPSSQIPADVKALQSAHADIFTPYFSGDQLSGRQAQAAHAIGAFELQPANARLQTKAVQEFVSAAESAGHSLGAIAANANRAIGTTTGGTQALMQGAYGEAQFQLQRSTIGAGRSESLAKQSAFYGRVASSPADGQESQANIASARQNLLDLQNQEVQYYQQRIMAQYQYQIQVSRAQFDFQRSTSRAEHDYLLSREREWQDYHINIERQQQDAAASMYSPYTRIQAQPVWDVGSLSANRQEQIGAMRTQLRDLRKLRDLGLSQSAIDQLRLYDPANAQQVAELLAELQADHSYVGKLNRQAATAERLAGNLVSQSPEFRRQQEDFKRTMHRQQTDFETQQARARADEATALDRMAQDLHTQDLEITNNMTSLTKDMNKILHGQFVDLTGQVHNSLASTLKQVQHYAPLIRHGLNSATSGGGGGSGGDQKHPLSATSGYHVVGGSGVNKGFTLSDISQPGTDTESYGNPNMHWGTHVKKAPKEKALSGNAKLAKDMAKQFGFSGPEWPALYQLWQSESGFSTTSGKLGPGHAYGIPQAFWKKGDYQSPLAHEGPGFEHDARKQIDWGLGYIAQRYGDPLGAWAHKSRTGWYASGSIFTGPQVIGVGERGPEAAIPLNEHGLKFMVGALRQYVGPADAKLIGSGGLTHATHVTHNESHHHDNRVQIMGETTVVADDPRGYAREMERKAQQDNLTGARGVAWSTSI